MENPTGEALVNLLITLGEKKNKVFLPSDYDNRIADGLVRMFQHDHNEELIETCVKKYILSSKEIAFSLNDFAMRLTGIYEAVKTQYAHEQEMKKLLRETKERMEQA